MNYRCCGFYKDSRVYEVNGDRFLFDLKCLKIEGMKYELKFYKDYFWIKYKRFGDSYIIKCLKDYLIN
jgi:hypothetical protein